jgi:hypothetical protein
MNLGTGSSQFESPKARRLGIRIDEQSRSDAAKLTEPRPMPLEERAQEFRQSEGIPPVR